MILTLDIGNTHKKYSLFQNGNLVEQKRWEEAKNIPPYTKALISNVTHQKLTLPNMFSVSSFFQESSFIDMPVFYGKTLGEDRLASCYYIYKNARLPCAVIDAGTFTTVDVVTSQGYMGGVILPGVELIQKSYRAGEKLPFQPLDLIDPKQLPHQTTDAIKMGLYLSVLSPIHSFLTAQALTNIFLTGGQGHKLNQLLKQDTSYSIHHRPSLIHLGLHLIATECL